MKLWLLIFSVIASMFFVAHPVNAQNGICPEGQELSADDFCIRKNINLTDKELILSAINFLLGLAGSLAVLFLIIGGVRYATAGDGKDATEHARRIIRAALTGLVLILIAFVLVRAITAAIIAGT